MVIILFAGIVACRLAYFAYLLLLRSDAHLLSALARVSCGVDLAEAGDAVVRIDLGGLQGTVSHQLLDLSQVSPTIHQVGCEGVPKYVWALFTLHIPLL